MAEHKGEVVGFVSCGPTESEPDLGEVSAIYLDAAYWGRGYGRALFAAALDALRASGFDEGVLWVLDTNDRARRFYEHAGWSADGAVKVEHRSDVELREVRYRGPTTTSASR